MAERTQRIVLHRLDDGVDLNSLDFGDAGYVLQDGQDAWRLFVLTNHQHVPDWKALIEPHLSATAPDEIINRSCSFILLIRHNSRNYALTGGYGYLRVKSIADPRFGLDVTLRMVGEDEIKAVHQRNLKGTTRQIFRAVQGYNPLLDASNFTRILRSLEGKGSFEGREFRISGRSCLALRTSRPLSQLPAVLDEVEEILQGPPKVKFPQGYELVDDPATVECLNGRMFDQFKAFWEDKADRDTLYLEFSEPLEQFRLDAFRLTCRKRKGFPIELTDFDLELIRDQFHKRSVTVIESPDTIKRMKVTGIKDGHVAGRPLSLWDMLTCETMLDQHCYIRLDGEWLRIRDELQANLNERLANVTVDRTLLPPWSHGQHPKELDYNRATAEARGWTCLDQDFIQFSGYSRLELCDQYDPDKRRFIHVKRTWGSKSAYLFTQGVTAAEFFKSDVQCRATCMEKWPGLFDEACFAQRHTVVYGIADSGAEATDFPLNMTYFAKLNLCNAISRLRDLDYEVFLAPVGTA